MKALTRPSSPLADAEERSNERCETAEDASKPTRYVCLLALIACLNSTNLGFDIGSVGGASLLMQEQMDWTDVQTEWFVARSVMLISAHMYICVTVYCYCHY